MGTFFDIDKEIAQRAARQHGNITRAQIIDLGAGDAAIHYRVQKGHLHAVHRGVYAVGRPPRTFLERACAAVLACGSTAALSHYSALVLWGLAGRPPAKYDVTITEDRRPSGITVHRVTTLLPRDLRTHQNIRVTSPARTLLDCAPLLTSKALTRAVNDSQVKRLLNRRQLLDVLGRNPKHPGTKLLTPHAVDPTGPTKSEFEDRFKRFCRRFELPQPQCNVKVCGYEVDVLFPDHKVIVELDSWTFHKSRHSFETDRERDAATLAAGHVTNRVTWERLTREPEREAARLRSILRERQR